MSIDTACSSALVAIHSARNDIRAGFAGKGITGGVNLIVCPDVIMTLSVASMLSPSRCKALDSEADGYVRGESAALVLLSQLKCSEAPTSDCVGLLWGSSVNQDGRSSSLTAPNGPSQSVVILSAWRSSGHHVSEMDVVQMHGTGTALGASASVDAQLSFAVGIPQNASIIKQITRISLCVYSGDPIEVGALAAAGAESPRVGSVTTLQACKSYLGHGEPAAGINGLTSAVATLIHAKATAILHLRAVNPHVGEIVAGSSGVRRWFAPRQSSACGTSKCLDPRAPPSGCSSFAFQVEISSGCAASCRDLLAENYVMTPTRCFVTGNERTSCPRPELSSSFLERRERQVGAGFSQG